ncbi:hypothetical protein ES705_44680 [subsurface metagenome]
MNSFCSTDGQQIAISLIGNDYLIRMDPLKTGGHSRRPSMGRLTAINLDIKIGQHRTSYRRYENTFFPYFQLIDKLGQQFMHYAMAAAGTVMHGAIHQGLCTAVNQFFLHNLFTFHS